MMKTAKQPEVEWSVPVRAEDVPVSGKIVTISPNDEERKALAKRCAIKSLESLTAKITMRRDNAHIVHVTGSFQAKVKQDCVMTLEPVITQIKDDFEAWYADESQAVSFRRAQHEAQSKKDLLDMPMLDENESPEPMTNGQEDIGELTAQYLSLAIPPYPTKEGLTYEVRVEEEAPAKNPMKLNPFAALKDWRPKD